MINELYLETIEESVKHPAIGRLVELGRRQSFVTFDDVLESFPEGEQEVDVLEEAFAALLSAGIPIRNESLHPGPSDEELNEEEEFEEQERREEIDTEDYLANVEIDDAVGLYMKEVGRMPLLTPVEEVELAQRIERGRLAREELAQGSVTPRRRLELQRLIEDGWKARDHLITANSRLVISIAKKYIRRGVTFLDLIQEGNIGLIRSVKKYVYQRGFKFSTYAHWWIRQAVTRAIADQGRVIRVPVHMADQISKMLRMQYHLTQNLGRDASVEELAEALNVTPQKVENLIQVARLPLSLEMPTDAEKESVLGDFIPDEDAPAPEELATNNLLRRDIKELFNNLPPREVRVLQLRYGLSNGRVYTLQEVGEKMGVTRERVRQIEAQALSRLRHPEVRRTLRGYLG